MILKHQLSDKTVKQIFAKISLLIISLSLKFNTSNFSKFTFSNTFISDMQFSDKSNFFNSLKLTFSNISILSISLFPKYKFSILQILLFPVLSYQLFYFLINLMFLIH